MPEITVTKKEILDMIAYLTSKPIRDTTKEFLNSVKAQVEQGFVPTENQLLTLWRIYGEHKTWRKRGTVTFREEVTQVKEKA